MVHHYPSDPVPCTAGFKPSGSAGLAMQAPTDRESQAAEDSRNRRVKQQYIRQL